MKTFEDFSANRITEKVTNSGRQSITLTDTSGGKLQVSMSKLLGISISIDNKEFTVSETDASEFVSWLKDKVNSYKV